MTKKLSFQMQFKEVTVEADKIKIKGFASTPQIDRYDDVVQPIAFQNSMESYMKNPIVLLGHNSDKPLGLVTEYSISPQGLEVTAELTNDIENTFKNIQDKVLRGFSIGFICKNWAEKAEGDRYIREITDLDLVEISVVSTPANPSSLFTLAKSIKWFFSEIEKKQAEDFETGAEVVEPEKKDAEQDLPDGEGEQKEPEPEVEKKEETPEEGEQEQNQTTSEEEPVGEDPTTPETEEDAAKDKTEDVKGDQKQPEVPTTVIIDGAQLDELKALITATVEAKIAEIEAKHKIVVDGLVEQIESGKKNFDALLKNYRELEDDILNIEIKRPGSVVKKGVEVKNFITYDQIFALQQR